MKSKLKQHLLLLIITVTWFYITNYFNIGCIWKAVFGFDCATCGVTRALLSILRLDFSAYINYNAMALPLICAFLVLIHVKAWFKPRHQAFFATVSGLVLVVNLIYYFYRTVNLQ